MIICNTDNQITAGHYVVVVNGMDKWGLYCLTLKNLVQTVI